MYVYIENQEATANNVSRFSCHERILETRNKLIELTNKFLFERTFERLHSYNILYHYIFIRYLLFLCVLSNKLFEKY